MATHDYVLDNATGANFRSDLNNGLSAVVTNNSGTSEPSTKYSGMIFADTNTTNKIIKQEFTFLITKDYIKKTMLEDNNNFWKKNRLILNFSKISITYG